MASPSNYVNHRAVIEEKAFNEGIAIELVDYFKLLQPYRL
jgi:hypothetical protein